MIDHLTEQQLVLGEDVIVIKQESEKYDQVGQIYRIDRFLQPPKVSVIFGADVYRFALQDLCLA